MASPSRSDDVPHVNASRRSGPWRWARALLIRLAVLALVLAAAGWFAIANAGWIAGHLLAGTPIRVHSLSIAAVGTHSLGLAGIHLSTAGIDVRVDRLEVAVADYAALALARLSLSGVQIRIETGALATPPLDTAMPDHTERTLDQVPREFPVTVAELSVAGLQVSARAPAGLVTARADVSGRVDGAEARVEATISTLATSGPVAAELGDPVIVTAGINLSGRRVTARIAPAEGAAVRLQDTTTGLWHPLLRIGAADIEITPDPAARDSAVAIDLAVDGAVLAPLLTGLGHPQVRGRVHASVDTDGHLAARMSASASGAGGPLADLSVTVNARRHADDETAVSADVRLNLPAGPHWSGGVDASARTRHLRLSPTGASGTVSVAADVRLERGFIANERLEVRADLAVSPDRVRVLPAGPPESPPPLVSLRTSPMMRADTMARVPGLTDVLEAAGFDVAATWLNQIDAWAPPDGAALTVLRGGGTSGPTGEAAARLTAGDAVDVAIAADHRPGRSVLRARGRLGTSSDSPIRIADSTVFAVVPQDIVATLSDDSFSADVGAPAELRLTRAGTGPSGTLTARIGGMRATLAGPASGRFLTIGPLPGSAPLLDITAALATPVGARVQATLPAGARWGWWIPLDPGAATPGPTPRALPLDVKITDPVVVNGVIVGAAGGRVDLRPGSGGGPSVGITDATLVIDGIGTVLSLAATLPDPVRRPMDVRVDTATVALLPLAGITVPPIAVSGGTSTAGSRLEAAVRLAAYGGRIPGEAAGWFDLRSGDITAEVSLGPVTFGAEDVSIHGIGPPFSNWLDDVQGTIGVISRVTRQDGRIETAHSVLIEDVSVARRAISATGLNGAIELRGPAPLTTPGPQQLAVATVSAGVPLTNGLLTFALDDVGGEMRLVVVDGRIGFADGAVTVAPTALPLDPVGETVTFDVSDVSLEALAGLANVTGLSGSGALHGSVPVTLLDGDIRIDHGGLSNCPDRNDPDGCVSGQIWYAPPPGEGLTADMLGQSGDIVVRALRNFRYDRLNATVSGTAGGAMEVDLQLAGGSPDVYDGYPIEFNVGLSGEIGSVLQRNLGRVNRSSQRVRDRIEALKSEFDR